jgi:hypothetical protein
MKTHDEVRKEARAGIGKAGPDDLRDCVEGMANAHLRVMSLLWEGRNAESWMSADDFEVFRQRALMILQRQESGQ